MSLLIPYVWVTNSILDKIQLPVGANQFTQTESLSLQGTTNGWATRGIAITIDVTQTYRPGSLAGDAFGSATLDVKYGLGKIVTNQDGSKSYQFAISNTNSLQALWNATNADQSIHLHDVLYLPAQLEGQDFSFIVQLIYTVPFGSIVPNVSSDSASYNLEFAALYYNGDTNATNAPTMLNTIVTDRTPGQKPTIDWLPVAVIGGLVVSGLIALTLVGREFRPERQFAGETTRGVGSELRDLGRELGNAGRGLKKALKF